VIHLPERSVTRFFIPLIDVLLLLFCIYLLMPLAEGGQRGVDDLTPAETREQAAQAKRDLEQARKDLKEAGQRLAELNREKTHLLHQRLAIKVLEIDSRNGKLYTYGDRGERIDINSKQDAERLIGDQRQKIGPRDLYYLFLFPRQDTGYPEQGQFEQYERWFSGVAHGADNPRGSSRG
jgi:hypothetical protein